MQDITPLRTKDKTEIAEYMARDNMEFVNRTAKEVCVKDTFYTRHGKRVLDIIISLIAFIVTLPINLVIGIVTAFDVGRPILFKQKRMGKDQKLFVIYKFRNMTNDTYPNGKLKPNEERVTKWGRFVRKTSLDELLNFVSVLNGSMSIIGPRPFPAYYADRMSERHKAIFAARPGLECPPYKGDGHLITWEERFESYVWYVEHCSLSVDLYLCFRVLQIALNKKSTNERAAASRGGFMGYNAQGVAIDTRCVEDKYVEEYCLKHGFKDLQDAIRAVKEQETAQIAV
ncbi:MAG: sugar transferase [Oscillospiraceae bacterium]|nr:sugar transferase [Oscillospiraceae bacterium]